MADNNTPAAVTAPTPAALDIERPACFYLGREYDLTQRAIVPDRPIMYDARDLTTHGVIVGMTGSGKTGLAISILEEAAIDGYPCIIIDPKGDLTNLCLQFPGLDPRQFESWLNPEDAQQKQQSIPEYARELSVRWRQGLIDSGQPPERIALLKQSSAPRIYTPGSEMGLPLSVLRNFAAPRSELSREALTQKIDATATALLGLTGIASDPIHSREHILIAQLLLRAWTQKRDLDLPRLILEVQNPPFATVGAYNLETFFPARDRLKFASLLNNVLAAPSFEIWTMGEALDLDTMLYREGKPQQLIFYVAHLDDTQRMFFTTLLLEEVLSWTRRQPGTSNLRALLYFDEVFGYLPPTANPPSKAPLLTLLKQARAFGVGVLLATQNPVDLDYKALSNAGTWFVGKLQTERDKARLLEGLETVAAEQGTLTDRSYLETVISSLGNRIFLLHNVHQAKPILFQSRWALSFLRGPLTRDQVSNLMKPVKQQASTAAPMAIPLCTHCHAELGPDVRDACPKCGQRPWANARSRVQDQAFRQTLLQAGGPVREAVVVPPATVDAAAAHAPVLPPDVRQFYLPAPRSGGPVSYAARVLGIAEVVFVVDKRRGREHRKTVSLLAEAPPKAGRPVAWDKGQPISGQLASAAEASARWGSVPESIDTGRKLKTLEKAFADYLYSTEKLSLFENRTLELISDPGEELETFRTRCRAAAAERARQALELEKAKFTPRFEALGLSLPEDPKETQSSGSMLGWLLAPFTSSKEPEPPSSRQEEKQRKLEADYKSKQAEIHEKWKRIGEDYGKIQVKPRKIDVRVTHFGLAWVPAAPS